MGGVVVFSYYFSPNLSEVEFERDLFDLGVRIKSCDRRPLLLLGNFNARSLAWNPGGANRKGRVLAGWTAGLDLILLNTGFVLTCMHPRDVSCVDLSWSSSSAFRKICDWRVARDIESLSDRYILMRVQEQIVGPLRRMLANKYFPRWCAGKTNMDLLCAAANVKAWSSPQGDLAVDSLVSRINETLREISDVSMPQVKSTDRPSAY